jgi:hypothetical protein
MTEQTAIEVEAPTDLDLLVAETAAEGQARTDLPEGAIVIPLYAKDGVTLVHEFAVLHPDDWPSSANEDPDQRRVYSWALKVLATDGDKAMWRALDPTNRQASEFINTWIRAAGQDPKGEAAPNGSSNGGPQRLRAI